MAYRWVVGDLRTGRIYRTVDTIGSWTTRFDATDTLSGSFPLGAVRPPSLVPAGYGEGDYGTGPYGIGLASSADRVEWPTAAADTAEGKSFVACAWVDEYDVPSWIAGGPIWTSDHDDSTNVLQFAGAGLESYYDHRYVIPLLTAKMNLLSVTYSAADLALIAKRLVELAHTHVGGDLPVDFPSDVDLGGAGTDHTHVYPGYEMNRTGEALRSLSKLKAGPEFQFVPRDGSDERFLEWFMRIGTKPTGMLTQQGEPWTLDRTVPNSMIQKIRTSRDGGRLADRVLSAGQGQGEGRPIESSEGTFLRDNGYPLLESETQATNVQSETGLLQSYADGLRARSGTPSAAYTVTVDAATFWKRCKGARAGDWANLKTFGHFSLPDGDNRVRILSMSGGGPTVDLQVALAKESE